MSQREASWRVGDDSGYKQLVVEREVGKQLIGEDLHWSNAAQMVQKPTGTGHKTAQFVGGERFSGRTENRCRDEVCVAEESAVVETGLDCLLHANKVLN